jgi:tyrosine-protein kinase
MEFEPGVPTGRAESRRVHRHNASQSRSTTARIRTIGSLSSSTGASGNAMTTSGIEDLKTALRRSAVLIVGIVLVGILALNGIRQAGGARYQAQARVLLNTSDLPSAALGISPVYVDPGRQDQAEQNLVNSPELYAFAAQRAGGAAGLADLLRNNTIASVSNNVVDFTTKTGDPDRSKQIANAVASAYPAWRAKVSGQAVDAAIAQVQVRIKQFGKTDELQKQLQQLQVAKTLSSGETLFVERASGATQTTPKPVSDSLLGAAIGLVVALLIVGLRELLDTTVRSEGDVEDALEAPVLATIQSLPRRMRTSVLGANAGRFNDEYELLAANIAQVFDGHEGTVQLAVTSALPGEGKTTTATNLAAALSRRGANVMLADFDLRKSAVSEFVGIPRDVPGVTDLLAGAADLRSVLWRVLPNGEGAHAELQGAGSAAVRQRGAVARSPLVETTTEGTLTVVPGGVTGTDTARQFARLPALLDSMPAEADFIVIDTPPALVVAGMAELAQSVDGVIVVVRHGVVHRRRLRALGRQARSWGGRLLGAVLNDSPGDESTLGYYYGRN